MIQMVAGLALINVLFAVLARREAVAREYEPQLFFLAALVCGPFAWHAARTAHLYEVDADPQVDVVVEVAQLPRAAAETDGSVAPVDVPIAPRPVQPEPTADGGWVDPQHTGWAPADEPVAVAQPEAVQMDPEDELVAIIASGGADDAGFRDGTDIPPPTGFGPAEQAVDHPVKPKRQLKLPTVRFPARKRAAAQAEPLIEDVDPEEIPTTAVLPLVHTSAQCPHCRKMSYADSYGLCSRPLCAKPFVVHNPPERIAAWEARMRGDDPYAEDEEQAPVEPKKKSKLASRIPARKPAEDKPKTGKGTPSNSKWDKQTVLTLGGNVPAWQGTMLFVSTAATACKYLL